MGIRFCTLSLLITDRKGPLLTCETVCVYVGMGYWGTEPQGLAQARQVFSFERLRGLSSDFWQRGFGGKKNLRQLTIGRQVAGGTNRSLAP